MGLVGLYWIDWDGREETQIGGSKRTVVSKGDGVVKARAVGWVGGWWSMMRVRVAGLVVEKSFRGNG